MKKMITRAATLLLVVVLFASTFSVTASAAAKVATKEELAKTPILNSVSVDKTKIGFGDRVNFIINATDQSGKGLKKAYMAFNTYDAKGNPIAYFGVSDVYQTKADKLGDFVLYYVHEDQTGKDSSFPTAGTVEIAHFFIEDNVGNISNYMGTYKQPMKEYDTVNFSIESAMNHKVTIVGKTLTPSEQSAASKVTSAKSSFQTPTTKPATPVKTPAKTPATTGSTLKDATTTTSKTTATLKLTNAKTISASEVAAIVKTNQAKKLKTSLVFDTTQNKKIETRITMNAEIVTADFAATAYTTGDTVTALQKKLAKSYKNELLVVDFTQKAKIVGTANLLVRSTYKDATGLVLSRYDEATGKATEIKDAKISVDKNGYISVAAAPYGVLVISKGALAN